MGFWKINVDHTLWSIFTTFADCVVIPDHKPVLLMDIEH